MDKLGFQCSVHSITRHKRAQVNLNKAILDHVDIHDDPNSLLIVYYTGHGFWHVKERLALSA